MSSLARPRLRVLPAVLLLTAYVLVAAAQEPADEATTLQAAESAYAERRWPDAVAAFEAFIAAYPESAQMKRAYLRLAQAHGQAAHDEQARVYYAKLIALDPNDTYANQGVSSWGNLYVRRYQYREAGQMCEEVMRMYPGTRAAEMSHYLIGNYLYAEKRYDDAIRGYTTFLEEYPESVYHRSALRQLIDILLRESRTDEAEELLAKYVSVTPDDSQILGQLAEVYAGQERYEDAVRLLERALQEKPEDLQLLESLGTAYIRSGDRPRARDAWQRMAGSAEPTYSTHQRIAHLLKQHGFYEEAAARYEAAIALQPRVAYLYTQLAEVEKIRGDIAGALSVYVRSLLRLGMAPAARMPVLTAIAELYPAKEAVRAFDDMEEVVRVEAGEGFRGDPAAVLTLAEARFMAEDYTGSLVWFERLAAATSDNGAAMAHYASTLEARGEDAAAEAFFASLVEMHPQAPSVPAWWSRMGQAMERQGRVGEAVAAYRAAIAADATRAQTPDVDASLARALMYGAHDPQAAMTHLAAARAHPRLAHSRLALDLLIAEAHMLMGSYEQAEAVLTRGSWGGAATASRAKYVLGELRLRQGRYDEATDAYMIVARTYQSSPWANDALARMTLIQANAGQGAALASYVGALGLRAAGDDEGAMRECAAVVTVAAAAPVAQDALLLLANLATEAADYAAAADAYAHLAAQEGHLADRALLELGRLHVVRDDGDEAAVAYERLLERSPTGAYAVTARAELRSLNAVEAAP
ncbi:tetratricopeptide repeat protein [Candidatus Poribacteria bacterium]|nr:tetratricopeptide repeat protein [Candidatus Poribacteria bacterium]MBT5534974.1 tetratricopeptide repeat protein [Candidatus Poribacteria bacterium]MBT7096500.1 tetratricopeptide repeat protein [Candidatus Poribacteria bacterium]MBT7809249.1 tetratricopeptide repeat protein [Candidatus Poribacteria bacterium]